MTKLELDLLSNGFNEKDLKRIKKSIKIEDKIDIKDKSEDYSLISEIKILRSFFLACFFLISFVLLFTNLISVQESIWDYVFLNVFFLVIFTLSWNAIMPISLGFKSWKYGKKRIGEWL